VQSIKAEALCILFYNDVKKVTVYQEKGGEHFQHLL
jgi:hypothetical protein